ncbi:MAG: hypothetical protein KDE63_12865 [Novosphingobium sp.]|nr:hypothetical protein [Novosphingobium sp.]MCC2098111.1 hypothetical protein [Hyphomicrobiales bacterium]
MRSVFGARASAPPVEPDNRKAAATSGEFRPEFRLKRPGIARRLFRRTLWTFLTLAAMAGTVHALLNPPAFLLAQSVRPDKSEPAWTSIRKPIPIYAFSGGLFSRPADDYSARRHTDGSRIDTLTFGDFGKDSERQEPWMRISLHRIAGPATEPPGFFVDMARLASIDGLSVTRTTVPHLMATRFGNFAVADLEIRDTNPSAVCLGYRMESLSPAFRISGISCGSRTNPVDRRLLSCTLDRLDLLSARDDRELSGFFAKSELRRASDCNPQTLASTGSRSGWLDHASSGKAVSALRLKSLPSPITR